MAAAVETKPEVEPLMDAEAVAAFLACSTKTLDNMLDRGEFPRPLPFSRIRKWSPAVIREWLRDQERLSRRR